ncbi:MAG: glycosyltransferase family 2 protein [Bacteroidales bacterium]|nr:glycosyltransferase family 2 protein [Bacteroidales bacterium]
MLDITAIILTYNEEIHIRRCIENVNQFAKKVYVIDCFSADRTAEIAMELGAEVVCHKWPGNQAEQFNWALDNLKIDTEWILRLDADEYLLPELVNELNSKLPLLGEDVSALSLSLARAYGGRILHHGIVNNVRIVRIFRKGKARYEKRLMDEHLSILDGKTLELKCQFVDDNRLPIGKFIDKHNNYASREAALLLDSEFQLSDLQELPQEYGKEVEKKRAQKARYAKMPLFWRSLGYFCYRYFLKLGFLDGKEGFLWDFFQGLWYRMLVDAKVYEVKKNCGNDKGKIKDYLNIHYHIKL